MNDIDRITEMTNQKIAYSIFERKEKDKMKKMKKITMSLCVCLLVIGSGVGVNAATGGKLVKTIQNAIRITIDGQDMNGSTYTDKDGNVWVKVKDKNGNYKFNKSELEKNDINVDVETHNVDGSEETTITFK